MRKRTERRFNQTEWRIKALEKVNADRRPGEPKYHSIERSWGVKGKHLLIGLGGELEVHVGTITGQKFKSATHREGSSLLVDRTFTRIPTPMTIATHYTALWLEEHS